MTDSVIENIAEEVLGTQSKTGHSHIHWLFEFTRALGAPDEAITRGGAERRGRGVRKLPLQLRPATPVVRGAVRRHPRHREPDPRRLHPRRRRDSGSTTPTSSTPTTTRSTRSTSPSTRSTAATSASSPSATSIPRRSAARHAAPTSPGPSSRAVVGTRSRASPGEPAGVTGGRGRTPIRTEVVLDRHQGDRRPVVVQLRRARARRVGAGAPARNGQVDRLPLAHHARPLWLGRTDP